MSHNFIGRFSVKGLITSQTILHPLPEWNIKPSYKPDFVPPPCTVGWRGSAAEWKVSEPESRCIVTIPLIFLPLTLLV